MTKLAESPYGDLYYANGELLNKGKVADPPAYRGGTREGGGLVKWSGDRIRPDGMHEECVLHQFKEDERYQGTLAGETTTHLRRPGQDNDAAMQLVETVRFDGITYHVPIIAAAGIVGGGGGGTTMELRSPEDRYRLSMQDDGNVVRYRRVGPDSWVAAGVAQFR